MHDPERHVVLLFGYPRSGSTILGKLLGEVPGHCFAGEVQYFWTSLARKKRCSCGLRANECEVWSSIGEGGVQASLLANGPRASGISPVIARSYAAATRAVNAHLMLGRPLRDLDPGHPRIAPYVAALDDLYARIFARMGARVVVDTSKWPADAVLASLVSSARVSVVHLVRDPRGAVFSRSRDRERREKRHPRQGINRFRRSLVLYDALGWRLTTGLAERVVRGLNGRTVRYEDVVHDPAHLFRTVTALTGVPFAPASDHAPVVTRQHILHANRHRFVEGPVVLREDHAWHEGLPRSMRGIINFFTWGGRRRYGYGAPATVDGAPAPSEGVPQP
jgi:hypothetical protein